MPGIVAERLVEIEIEFLSPLENFTYAQLVSADAGPFLQVYGESIAAAAELVAALGRKFG